MPKVERFLVMQETDQEVQIADVQPQPKREKMHRIEKNKVYFPEVQAQLAAQRKRNGELQGTGYFCDLKPCADKMACSTCREFETCGEKLALKYIWGKASKKGAQRRKRRQENFKKNLDSEWVKEQETETEQPYTDEENRQYCKTLFYEEVYEE